MPDQKQLIDPRMQCWQQFQQALTKGRLAHALLLIGPLHADLDTLALKMAASLLCIKDQEPCGACQSCLLVNKNTHPDLHELQPNQPGEAIKVDPIRRLQTMVFTSPKLAKRRVVIIHSAERMNVSASNALLKLLEEPPANVIFILIAEHISTMLPTILSRCQLWRIALPEQFAADYLDLGKHYPLTSERGVVFSQLEVILQDLQDLLNHKNTVCIVVAKWSSYSMSHLLWLLYLLNAELIKQRILGGGARQKVNDIALRLGLLNLFNQLDELNGLIHKINHHSNINGTLALEKLLLGYQMDKGNDL